MEALNNSNLEFSEHEKYKMRFLFFVIFVPRGCSELIRGSLNNTGIDMSNFIQSEINISFEKYPRQTGHSDEEP